MGLLQIDSVNVLVRSHELPLFARLGPHSRSLVDDAVADGYLFEFIVHEASFVQSVHHPLIRWRMHEPHRWTGYRRVIAANPDLLESVYRRVADDGPLCAGDLGMRVGRRSDWWDADDGKIVLEALFHQGRLAVRRRPRDFARVYDLPERVLPASVLALPAVDERDARKELLVLAARSHGVGTVADLADYHRQRSLAVVRELVGELVEEGRLTPVAVEGWKDPAYMDPGARVPRRLEARALLSPFDPVVWNRDRAVRLFGFHYRIEIYTPAPKRRYGYYVLPFLLGDQLVARVDLKADRAAGTLLCQAAWLEPGFSAATVAAPLMEELDLMAAWLGLARVVVVGRGDLPLQEGR